MSLDILDVAIGLVFVYLVLSLVVTATNELFAALFKRRATTLRAGIVNLMTSGVAERVYAHPLIRSLYRGSSGPSYIPSKHFAIALLDALEATDEPCLARECVAVLNRDAGDDDARLRLLVEEWFNTSMERVSGWYKRRTQIFSLLTALVITIGVNADTLKITQTLWSDPAMREAAVAQAQRFVAEQPRPGTAPPIESSDAPPPPPLPPYEQAQIEVDAASDRLDAARADLQAMRLPIGWLDTHQDTFDHAIARFRLVTDDATEEWPGSLFAADGRSRWLAAADAHLLGWLITILAISVGAPFWFDMLNRIISIRSVGKAPEEAQKPPREIPKPKQPGDMD